MDEGPFAGAFDERPPEPGLQIVVVLAESVAVVEPGVMGFVPFGAMVELDAPHAGAVEPGALRGLPPQGNLLRHRRPTTQMGHVGEP